MNNIHILKIPEFQENKIACAFTSYVYNDATKLPLASMHFTPCEIAFNKATIKYRSYLEASNEGISYVLEFFIIFDKDGEPLAMVQRWFTDGVLDEDTIGYTSYDHRPYHHDCLMDTIKALSMQEPVTYHFECDQHCDCDEAHSDQ